MKMLTKTGLFLASVYFWFSLFFISAVMFHIALLIFLLTFLFDKNRIVMHYFSCFWAYVTVIANPMWKMKIVGRSRIRKRTAYVMVANHSSGADIQLLFRIFRPFKWVAKKSLFSMPFIGWTMYLNNYIPIERERGKSQLQMMDKAIEAVKSGNSVIIFPEGTRTRDGNLQSFKSGAFRIALETGAPILPVAIKGTFKAIQKGGLTIQKSHNITGYILEPLTYEDFKGMEPREIALMVQERIRSKLEDQTRL